MLLRILPCRKFHLTQCCKKMNHQHDMAKIQIKSEKLTPFGGIFPIMEYFNSKLSPVIDRVLGLRCKQFGYQYSEIIRSLMCVYLCGGSCVEDLSSHLLRHLSLHQPNDELDLSGISTDITMYDYKDTDKLSQTVKVAKAALLVCKRTIYLVILLGYLIQITIIFLPLCVLYLWHNGFLPCVHSIRIETASLTENIRCVVVMKHIL